MTRMVVTSTCLLGIVGLAFFAPDRAVAQAPTTRPAATRPSSDLTPLIERIAQGNEDEAADATDRLIDRVVGPLADALKDIDARPPEQQRRLLDALSHVMAQMRLHLYRASLPAPDQKLFDTFVARHRDLAERLFQDDPRRRLAALQQVPLEPNTGAGELLIAKIYDWDAEVVDAALTLVASLKDDVVARGLDRFLTEATAFVRSGRLDADQQDVAIVLADGSRKAAHALGQIGNKNSVPAILDALAVFGRPPYRQLFMPAEALDALGRIGEERAVPALLDYLEDHEIFSIRNVSPGAAIQQTVGDAALLALARIYGLRPEALGFSVDKSQGETFGFTNEDARAAAVRTFLRWHKQNADKPRAQRAALTTQPASDAAP